MKPPIPWYGGKTNIVDKFDPYIPEHHCYVEPYGGAGAMLFYKKPSRVEIYNDLHKDVVNLYISIRDYFDDFHHKVEATPYSRQALEYAWSFIQYDMGSGLPDFITEHARCFFVIARQAFSSRHDKQMKHYSSMWSSSKVNNKAVGWMNAIDRLPEIHERLQNVQIECLPALEVMKRYDGKDTFMYIDPPYMEDTRKELNTYVHEMTDRDHLDLLYELKRSQSMILLSGYHNEFYDEVLNAWCHKDFAHTASAINTEQSPDADKKRIEVVWWNKALQTNRVGTQQLMELEV